MDIDPKIFKAYDIRAIYPTQINEEVMSRIAKAAYTFFRNKLQTDKQISVVMGCDMRTSSPSLFKVAKEAFVEMGARVIDIGLISTPSFYFAVFHMGYDAGFQVTASHNPKEYNGAKFVLNSPNGLIKIGKSTGMEDVKNIAIQGTFAPPQLGGKVEKKEGVMEEEVTNALTVLGNPEIKKFKIVADTANAMGAQYIAALFKHVPAELIKMNFEFDGTFPAHQPDPLNFENLKDLQARVLEEKADFGLAPDGDGDRLFFIDEKGQVVPASIITSIIATEMLRKHPGATILFDIRYILGAKKIVEENGGKYDVTKVGHAFITESMNKTGAVFGGESSAHYFYKDAGNGENQLMTILYVLKVLTEKGKTLSELADEYRRSYESTEFNFRVTNAPEILSALKEKYKDGELSELDGVSVTYQDWRFNVRTSNTEPLLRLNVEAYDKTKMEEKRDELKAFIKSVAKEDTSASGH
ncbi:MAG TPA: phosphomannomutase/phosphoglucomutase [Patescibacteria group bacterium]|nr:phosphomannomutase/phosphoglucomutase [Patescibacteria group bacterium]